MRRATGKDGGVNNVKPGAMMMLGGGALLFISSFLNWYKFGPFTQSGIDTDLTGLQGIVILLIGADIVAVTAIRSFAADSVKLPERVLGLTLNQSMLLLGFAAFLMMFGLQFADNTSIGVFLGWIGAAVVVAGVVMEDRSPATGSTPTTEF